MVDDKCYFRFLPLYIVLQGIWQILTFHVRGKEGPLVTNVRVTGFVAPSPASTYTGKCKKFLFLRMSILMLLFTWRDIHQFPFTIFRRCYVAFIACNINNRLFFVLTMIPIINSTNSRRRVSSRNDKLIIIAYMINRLRPCYVKLIEI